jgi:hypothetical protein
MRVIRRDIPSIPAPTTDPKSIYSTLVSVKNAIDILLGHSAKLDEKGNTELKYVNQGELADYIFSLESKITKL